MPTPMAPRPTKPTREGTGGAALIGYGRSGGRSAETRDDLVRRARAARIVCPDRALRGDEPTQLVAAAVLLAELVHARLGRSTGRGELGIGQVAAFAIG